MDQPHNLARKTNRFTEITNYPALYRYHVSWTVTNEFTIDVMTRGAMSVIPPIADPGMTVAE